MLGSIKEGQINALHWVQKKVAKFVNLMDSSNWEMAQHRKKAHICALYKEYSGEAACKAIGDRLRRPCYLSSVNHDWKVRNRRQKTDIGKYSFVNRAIQLWNKLPVNAVGSFTFKLSAFKKRVRKVMSKMKGIRSEEEIKYFQEQGLKCDK